MHPAVHKGSGPVQGFQLLCDKQIEGCQDRIYFQVMAQFDEFDPKSWKLQKLQQ